MAISSFIVHSTSIITLASHIALVIFLVGLWLKVPALRAIKSFLGRYVLGLSFVVVLVGFVGSLLYSEGLGYEPCVLCWIGRVFLYPQIIMIALAMYFKDLGVLKYLLGLSVIGGLIALYQSLTLLGGPSFTACTSEGGSCAVIYVLEYGYITIPMMALTAFVLMIVLCWAGLYQNRASSIGDR